MALFISLITKLVKLVTCSRELVTRYHRGLTKLIRLASLYWHLVLIYQVTYFSVRFHLLYFSLTAITAATISIAFLMPRTYGKGKQTRLAFAPLSSSPPGSDKSTRSQKDRLATLRYDHPSLPSLCLNPLQRGKSLTRREESSTPPKKVLSEGTPSSEPEQTPQRRRQGRFGLPHSYMHLSLIGLRRPVANKIACQGRNCC